MRTRPFYYLTCALAVVAVVVTLASKQYAGQVARAGARAAQTHSPEEREALDRLAHQCASQSGQLDFVALVVLGLATAAWGCSVWRQEGGLQSVPLLLLVLVGLLQLLMV